MNMELKEFVENVKNQFEEEVENFGPDTHFRELDEWSSLLSLSIIAMVDDEYDVVIKTDEIKTCTTVEDLFNLVNNKKA